LRQLILFSLANTVKDSMLTGNLEYSELAEYNSLSFLGVPLQVALSAISVSRRDAAATAHARRTQDIGIGVWKVHELTIDSTYLFWHFTIWRKTAHQAYHTSSHHRKVQSRQTAF
jgi:hypothetical protein